MATVIYPSNFEAKIGFDIIREQCRALCTMLRSRELIDAERFSASVAEVERRQGLADEMRRLVMSGAIHRDELFDIADLVDKIRIEGTFLDVAEVARLGHTLSAAASIVGVVRSCDKGEYPFMVALTEGVETLSHIVAEISRIIDEQGGVRDSASPELAAVRREIRSHEGQISKRLHAVLQSAKSAGIVDADASISIREGRAVIPVTASNKRK